MEIKHPYLTALLLTLWIQHPAQNQLTSYSFSLNNDTALGTASSGVSTYSVLNPHPHSTGTIPAPGNFPHSKENASSTAATSSNATEINSLNTAPLRYLPSSPLTALGGKPLLAPSTPTTTQQETAPTTADDPHTLDVVNWNIEWFGGPMGPSDDNLQQANVKAITDSLNADLYALCEIVDTDRLARLVASMPGYAYTVSDYAAGAPTPSSAEYVGAQKLAFIYKTSVVTNVKARGLLRTSATAYDNWANGRFPYLLEADVVNGTGATRCYFILIHGRTDNASIDYQRRKDGAKELKDTLDAQFSTAKVVLLGDFNDDLDATISPGITPPLTSYDDIVKDSTDADSYRSPTLTLSLAGFQSRAGSANMIDHVVLSNEAAPDYVSRSARVVAEVEQWVADYSHTTSDHYPIISRYLLASATTDLRPVAPSALGLVILSNPVGNSLTFSLTPRPGKLAWQVLDAGGKLLLQSAPTWVSGGARVETLNSSTLPAGVYFLRVINHLSLTTVKFIRN